MRIMLNLYSAEFIKDKLHLKERQNDVADMPVPTDDSKPVLIPKYITFQHAEAGTLTKYIDRRLFCINSEMTYLKESHFAPAELEYLIKQSSKNLLILDSVLTEPVYFSHIWPLLKRVPEIVLRIKNLVIDGGITHALRHRPWEVRTNVIHLYECCASENEIMEVIECLLAFPTFPTRFDWCLKPQVQNIPLQPIANKIKERMRVAGYVLDRTNGACMDTAMDDFVYDKTLIVRTRQKIFHVLVLPHD
uniref:P-loop containing nucleoside triphosphate hydrolase protein n=1 Tax=Panagrellus redivivus TaxID=6233 RepID=A0A7E4URQ8_PANRE